MPTIRDAAYGMEEALRQVIEYVMNRKVHLKKYYILIHAKTYDTDQILSKVVIMHRQPPKLLGTVCYEIDNTMGTQRRLWVLPFDFPIDERLLDVDKRVPDSIIKSGEGMLIIN